MTSFAAKPSPDSDKLRGGYYTPLPIAVFIAKWALQAGSQGDAPMRVLEPSCGDGAILQHLVDQDVSPIGIELISTEAERARENSGATVVNEDFFQWFDPTSMTDRFDAVVGNPPYIRFGNWAEPHRSLALDYMSDRGLGRSKLTNAWLPFVVAAVDATRPGGRVAMVLPAELLQVGYARRLRAFLVDNCSHIDLVSFRSLVFPGVLQEVVLLLAEVGQGPAAFRGHELGNIQDLKDFSPSGADIRAPLHAEEKWTNYYLSANTVRLIREFERSSTYSPIGDFARVNVGVVTGRNSFFCLTGTQKEALGLSPWCRPLLSRSAHIGGLDLNATRFGANEAANHKTWLLAIPEDTELSHHPDLLSYVREGEEEGVNSGYKTRIRRRWWSVPSTTVPDGFMLRQISTLPRLFTNSVGATSTDTVHRVFMKTSSGADQLAVAALNSITFMFAELYGRSYGGGILELEPSEAVKLLVPDPSLVTPRLVALTSDLLDANKVTEAVELVDAELLEGQLGIARETIERFREAGETLRDRRLGRSRSASSGST